mmetsp:Transcript_18844/g.16680  ORF Transcript_18844/g.16680 Transcript_18844/m.16680 type:complete len:84 (+) Transcript_18844:83-334(+)
MPYTKQEEIIEIAKGAYQKLQEGEWKYYKDMAKFIKEKVDEKSETGSWHVIVGTQFGSFFSYESKHVFQFRLEHVCILLFKHG